MRKTAYYYDVLHMAEKKPKCNFMVTCVLLRVAQQHPSNQKQMSTAPELESNFAPRHEQWRFPQEHLAAMRRAEYGQHVMNIQIFGLHSLLTTE